MSTAAHTEHAARSDTGDQVRPVEAYPSLRAAAKLIGITAGALSRRKDVERVRAGREERIPAAEVVRLAGIYRRRPPSRVAAELVSRAILIDPGLEQSVGMEVDEALEDVAVPKVDVSVGAFIEAAHRLLPAALAAQVEATLHAERRGNSAVGWSPGTE